MFNSCIIEYGRNRGLKITPFLEFNVDSFFLIMIKGHLKTDQWDSRNKVDWLIGLDRNWVVQVFYIISDNFFDLAYFILYNKSNLQCGNICEFCLFGIFLGRFHLIDSFQYNIVSVTGINPLTSDLVRKRWAPLGA